MLSQNIKEYRVNPIPSKQTEEWLLFKHYARRKAPIIYAFGLFDKEKKLQGVCTFGMPTVQMNNGKCIFHTLKVRTIELNRLVVNEGLKRNILSFFVAHAIKQLPPPLCLVSFADPFNGHHGYIYQATNWLYTGMSEKGGKNKTYIFEGRNYHGKTITEEWIRERFGSYDKSLSLPDNCRKFGGKVEDFGTKHRYIMFIGTVEEKFAMKADCKYTFYPYPKGENKRYDASYQVKEPTTLF